MNKKSNSLGNISPLAQDRIKTELKKKGWTQKQLAENVFVHDKYLSKVLNGKCPINSGLLESLAEALGVRAEYLLYHDEFRTEKEYLEAMGNDKYVCALEAVDYFRSIGYKISYFKQLQDNNELEEEMYVSITPPHSKESFILLWKDLYRFIIPFKELAINYMNNLCSTFMVKKEPDFYQNRTDPYLDRESQN